MAKPLSDRWQPMSAWVPNTMPRRGGAARGDAGVRIEFAGESHVLSIVACSGRRDDLARSLAAGFGWSLPGIGRLATGLDGDLVWSGPDHWLAITHEAVPAALRRKLEAVASVTDQSSARALLHVSGPDARDALAKGFAIDLHPAVFTPGRTAVTNVAHISVQVWQREPDRYTIAVPRSFASSFWAWLTAAAAGYGWEVAA